MAYVTTTLGELVTQAYVDSLAYVDQLGNAATRDNPWGINPGGGGLGDADRRALYGYLVSTGDQAYTATINALRAPGSTWILSGSGYDAVVSIPAAADRDQSLLAEVGPIVGPFIAAIGAAGALSGAFGAAGAAGASADAAALEVFTAQDAAWGAATLDASGQTYAQFLSSLSTPIATPIGSGAASSTSSAAEWAAAAEASEATQGAAMLQNAGITYDAVTAAPLTSNSIADKAAGALRQVAGRLVAMLTAPGKAPAPQIAAPAVAPNSSGGLILAGLAILAGLTLAK